MELPKYSESTEVLPGYEATLEFHGVSLMKTEFISPYHSNSSRGWSAVYLELNSTQLNIFEINDKKLSQLITSLYSEVNSIKRLPHTSESQGHASAKSTAGKLYNRHGHTTFEDESDDEFCESKLSNLKHNLKKLKNEKLLSNLPKYHPSLSDNKMLFEPSDDGTFKFKGKLIACYTLANLCIGEAPSLENYRGKDISAINFVKYRNVLRARIEYKQILFQFWSFPAMLSWYRNLMMGKDLATPLESRSLTKFKTIPSRTTYRELLIQRNDIYDVTSALEKSDSDEESIFTRRGSVSTLETYESATIENTIDVHGFRFVSNERDYNMNEKKYISNCLPKLNSYDGWCGKLLTISNFPRFLKQQDQEFEDVFLEPPTLPRLILSYDKSKHKVRSGSISKTFMIHQNGLISISSKNLAQAVI